MRCSISARRAIMSYARPPYTAEPSICLRYDEKNGRILHCCGSGRAIMRRSAKAFRPNTKCCAWRRPSPIRPSWCWTLKNSRASPTHHVPLFVDNTFATPFLAAPLSGERISSSIPRRSIWTVMRCKWEARSSIAAVSTGPRKISRDVYAG